VREEGGGLDNLTFKEMEEALGNQSLSVLVENTGAIKGLASDGLSHLLNEDYYEKEFMEKVDY